MLTPFARLTLAAAAILITASTVPPSHTLAMAPEPNNGPGKAPAKSAYQGRRWRLGEIAHSSWGGSGVRKFVDGKSVKIGDSAMGLQINKFGSAWFDVTSPTFNEIKEASHESAEYSPPDNTTLERWRDAGGMNRTQTFPKAPVDVQIEGLALLRVESTWEDRVWGVLSGYSVDLEGGGGIFIVDEDVDGRISTGDRIVYGDSGLSMPWHNMIVTGGYIYFDLEIIMDGTAIGAHSRKLADAGGDKDTLAAWNDLRIAHGLAPLAFDAAAQAACVKHADYLKRNKTTGQAETKGKPGYTPEGAEAGLTSSVYKGGEGGRAALKALVHGLYGRAALLDPRGVVAQLGGNDTAYLMGFARKADLVLEKREMTGPQLFPAPYSTVAGGGYANQPVSPSHPLLTKSKTPGLPVTLRLFDAEVKLADVNCHLYLVKGDARTGERGAEVECHLSHPGKEVPKGLGKEFDMIALTPHKVLARGVYEAVFRYKVGDVVHDVAWRFSVAE